MQTEIILYKNTQYALNGTIPGASFAFPGVALSANTAKFYADLQQGQSVKYARWVLAWNPQVSSPTSPTGVRLVKSDSGPTNIEEIARIDSPIGQTYSSPKVDQFIITDALNSILADGIFKHLGHQTYGNGMNGCLIYGSWIEIVWS